MSRRSSGGSLFSFLINISILGALGFGGWTHCNSGERHIGCGFDDEHGSYTERNE